MWRPSEDRKEGKGESANTHSQENSIYLSKSPHLSKSSPTNQCQQLKILHAHFMPLQPHIFRLFTFQILQKVLLAFWGQISVCNFPLQGPAPAIVRLTGNTLVIMLGNHWLHV
jgi:hypothetical protein